MRILIFRSERRTGGEKPKNVYAQEFTSHYAEKVIGNLVAEEGFCSACGPDCNACRTPYNRKKSPGTTFHATSRHMTFSWPSTSTSRF